MTKTIARRIWMGLCFVLAIPIIVALSPVFALYCLGSALESDIETWRKRGGA